MKIKTIIIFSSIIFLSGVLTVTASQISLSSGKSINISNGETITLTNPLGAIQGFSTHPPRSSVCGTDTSYYLKMLAAGANKQRTDIFWNIVQPTSSLSYNWVQWDCMINDALSQGISTVFIIDSTPDWAATSTCTAVSGQGKCAPINSTVVSTFANAVAVHFLGRVYSYEIYNEPNEVGNWNPAPDVADYSRDLNAAYSAIKSVDLTITVVSGGIANVSTPPNIGSTAWVNGLYTNNANFDVLGFHPYTYPYTAEYDVNIGHIGSWYAMTLARAIMVSNGDSSKQIWATEYGAPTCGPGTSFGVNQASFNFGSDYMTFQAQEQIAKSAVNMLAVEPWVGNFFWYTLNDGASNDSSTPENCFGAYFTNGNLKPVYSPIRAN